MKKIVLFPLICFTIVACKKSVVDDYSFANEAPFIQVAQSSYVVGNASTDTTILVDANVWWNVAISYPEGTKAWVTEVTPTTTNATKELNFSFMENLSSSDRTATVTVSPKVENATEPCVFTLVQRPSGPFITVDCNNITENDLLLGVVTDECLLSIHSNYDWSIDNSQAPWLTFTPDSGTGNVESVAEVICSYPSNNSGEIKTGEITITAGDMVKRFAVRQDKDFAKATLEIINDETFMAEWTPVVGASGYTVEIRDLHDGTIADIPLESTETSYDLAAHFTEHPYSGSIKVSIKASSADPEIFSISNSLLSHPYFADESGDGSSEGNEFCISTKRHLANISASGLLDKYYKQTADLDMTGIEHSPIGTAADATRFRGSYDGAGHSILNLSAEIDNADMSCWGLFGVVTEGAVIKNITFNNCQLSLVKVGTKEPLGFGFAVASNYGGIIENVHTINCKINLNTVAGAIGVGSIVGSNRIASADVPGIVRNCTTTGGEIATASTVKAVSAYIVGGIVGIGVPGARIENCGNESTIIKSRGAATGGIVGQNCSVLNSYNKADLEAATNTGGIIGKFDAAGGVGEISNCYNAGHITYRYGTAAYYHGGIIGTINTGSSGNIKITQCFNSGTLEALILDRPIIYGGIVARSVSTSAASKVVITNCFNTGDVIAPCIDGSKTSNSGGIIGDVANSATEIRCCYNVGNVTVGANETQKGSRAGILGNRTSVNSLLDGCYYLTGTCDSAIAIGGSMASGDGVTDVPAGGKSASDLKDPSTYGPSWDFNTIWEAPSSGYDYPQLKGMPYVKK